MELRDNALKMIEALDGDFVWECRQVEIRRRVKALADLRRDELDNDAIGMRDIN